MTIEKKDMILADGVYCDMPDSEYHSIQRLSNSGAQALTISPATFWAGSWLNPDREPGDSTAPHLVFGKAYHCAILEPEIFAAKYMRALVKDDMPKGEKCLTDADMKKALADLGEAQTKGGETVMMRAERLREAGYSFPIWHLEEKRWADAAGDRILLSPDMWKAVTRDRDYVVANPEIAALFSGGISEVSVLWTCPDTGVKMKARFDYLRSDLVVDLKTFANSQGKVLRQHLVDSFRYNRYYMQFGTYWQAAEMIKSADLPIIGEASEKARAVIAGIKENPIPFGVTYVFQEKGGIPNVIAASIRVFQSRVSQRAEGIFYGDMLVSEQELPKLEFSNLYNRAATDLLNAKRAFKIYCEMYADGAPWYNSTPLIEITDSDYSPYFLTPEEETR